MNDVQIAIEEIVELETPVATCGAIRTAESYCQDPFSYLYAVAVAG